MKEVWFSMPPELFPLSKRKNPLSPHWGPQVLRTIQYFWGSDPDPDPVSPHPTIVTAWFVYSHPLSALPLLLLLLLLLVGRKDGAPGKSQTLACGAPRVVYTPEL